MSNGIKDTGITVGEAFKILQASAEDVLGAYEDDDRLDAKEIVLIVEGFVEGCATAAAEPPAENATIAGYLEQVSAVLKMAANFVPGTPIDD